MDCAIGDFLKAPQGSRSWAGTGLRGPILGLLTNLHGPLKPPKLHQSPQDPGPDDLPLPTAKIVQPNQNEVMEKFFNFLKDNNVNPKMVLDLTQKNGEYLPSSWVARPKRELNPM